MPPLRFLVCLFLPMLVGCDAAKAPDRPAYAAIVKSTDFALLPCGPSTPRVPCLLVMAGGKRLLFGAPPGLRGTMDADMLVNLDAIFLFSLQGPDLEGLDEVRNESWIAGRDGPLPVGGPTGTRDVVAALNKAYEVSDAQIFVKDPPRGGFGAALLGVLPGEGDAKAQVFDTGDLIVTKIETADGLAAYWIDYGGRRAVLQPCDMDQAIRFNDRAAIVIACDGGDTAWPLDKLNYLLRGEKPAF